MATRNKIGPVYGTGLDANGQPETRGLRSHPDWRDQGRTMRRFGLGPAPRNQVASGVTSPVAPVTPTPQPAANPPAVSAMLRNPTGMGIPVAPAPLPTIGTMRPAANPAGPVRARGVMVGGRQWNPDMPTQVQDPGSAVANIPVGREGVSVRDQALAGIAKTPYIGAASATRGGITVGRMTGAEAANGARLSAYHDERNATGTPGLGGVFLGRFAPGDAPGGATGGGVIGPAPIDHAAVLARQRADPSLVPRPAALGGKHAAALELARQEMQQRERMAASAQGSQERIARYGVDAGVQGQAAARQDAMELQRIKNEGVTGAAAARSTTARTPEQMAALEELKALNRKYAETTVPTLPDDADEEQRALFDAQMAAYRQLKAKIADAQGRLKGTSAPAAPAAQATNTGVSGVGPQEVVRSVNGRPAVYNSVTKQFIRWG